MFALDDQTTWSFKAVSPERRKGGVLGGVWEGARSAPADAFVRETVLCVIVSGPRPSPRAPRTPRRVEGGGPKDELVLRTKQSKQNTAGAFTKRAGSL